MECTRQMILQKANTIFSSNVRDLNLVNKIKYSNKPVCPFVFTNAKLGFMNFLNQIDSFLAKNLFRFQSISPNESSASINSNQYTTEFEILGQVRLIQVDLFKPFTYLKKVAIMPHVYMNFFHQIGIEWTTHMPTNTEVQLVQFSQQLYDFPDEDFCLFADWPHKKMIVPLFIRLHGPRDWTLATLHKHIGLANTKLAFVFFFFRLYIRHERLLHCCICLFFHLTIFMDQTNLGNL
jgi:hypothetical protein